MFTIAVAALIFTAACGSVVLYHASPLWIPKFKPFNCPFCMIVWFCWTFIAFMPPNVVFHRELIPMIALSYPLFAAILVVFCPWLFRPDQVVLNEEHAAVAMAPTSPVMPDQDFLPTDVVVKPPTAPIAPIPSMPASLVVAADPHPIRLESV